MTNETSAESIGIASMESDGTLHLRLQSRGPGPEGVGYFTYKPSDPMYAQILTHIGPIGPGESRAVKPWPQETENP